MLDTDAVVGEDGCHEQVCASVDMIEQFGRTTVGDELQSLFPAVGTEIGRPAAMGAGARQPLPRFAVQPG